MRLFGVIQNALDVVGIRIAVFNEGSHFRNISFGDGSNGIVAKGSICRDEASVDVGVLD